MDGVRIPRRIWFLTLLLWSLGLHVGAIWLLSKKLGGPSTPAADAVVQAPLQTRVVTPAELQRLRPQDPATSLVDSEAAPEVKSPRDRARYLGERTQRVERETVAKGFGVRGGGKPAPPAAKAATEESRLGRLGLGPQSGLTQPRSLPSPAPAAPSGTGEVEGPSGSADVVDKNVAVGTRTLLNTDEYVYASFFNRIRREVAPRWEPLIRKILDRSGQRIPAGVYRTSLVTILDREGNILDVQVADSSGEHVLDEAAKSAIRLSLRFPRPPAEMADAEGRVRFPLSFVVNLDLASGFRFDYQRDPKL